MFMPRARDKISFLVGLVLFLIGGIPLASKMGIVGFVLPAFLAGLVAAIAIWIIALGGFYVVIDGFIEPKTHQLHWFLVAIGLVLLLVGLIPILHNLGYIGFGNFGFLNNLMIYNAIITLEGLLLMIGGLTEH